MTRMLRAFALLVLCSLLGASLISTPALAEHDESDHSANVKFLAKV